MSDINKTTHTGRICQQPELKQTQNGVSVCSFTLAVKRPRTKDTTDFLNVVCWRQNAEFISKYAGKGSLVGIVGTLTSRKFQDNNGKNHTAIEIVADEVSIFSNVQQNAGTAAQDNAPAYSETDTPNFEDINDDDKLPF